MPYSQPYNLITTHLLKEVNVMAKVYRTAKNNWLTEERLLNLGELLADNYDLIEEALDIAQNSLEFDGDRTKADAIALLIFDIKEAK